jgi:hypothetical protein
MDLDQFSRPIVRAYVQIFCLKFIRNYIIGSVNDQNSRAVKGAFCVGPLEH